MKEKKKETKKKRSVLINVEKIDLSKNENVIKLQERVPVVMNEAENIKIEDKKDVEKAGEFIKKVKIVIRKAEEERKKITKPLLEAKKNVDVFFKKLTGPFQEAEKIVKRKINDYYLEEQRKLRELEEQRKKEIKEKGIEEDLVVPEVKENIEKTVGNVTVREDIEVKVVNKMAVVKLIANGRLPVGVIEINEYKLKQIIKMMEIKELEGVIISKKNVVSARVK